MIARFDPTRTTLLRKHFCRALRVRFNHVKYLTHELIAKDNAFGITMNNRWQYLNDSQKLDQFKLWLRHQINQHILSTEQSDEWLRTFIERGYERGRSRAYTDVSRSLPSATSEERAAGSRHQFMASTDATKRRQVDLLTARANTELEGVTDFMVQQATRELLDGLASGLSPADIARNVVRRMDIAGRQRAESLARTEIVRAHSESVLDSLEAMGVTEIGVAVEWTTSGGPRVCQKCKDLEGVVLTTKEARGLFPRHVNCQCSPIPANVGEDERNQVRTRYRIRQAFQRSVAQDKPKTKRALIRKSQWAGAKRVISKKRPKSLF